MQEMNQLLHYNTKQFWGCEDETLHVHTLLHTTHTVQTTHTIHSTHHTYMPYHSTHIHAISLHTHHIHTHTPHIHTIHTLHTPYTITNICDHLLTFGKDNDNNEQKNDFHGTHTSHAASD